MHRWSAADRRDFTRRRRDALAALATRVAPVPLFRYYQSLLQQRALLAHPLQPRLVAEALLIDYRDLFYAAGAVDCSDR